MLGCRILHTPQTILTIAEMPAKYDETIDDGPVRQLYQTAGLGGPSRPFGTLEATKGLWVADRSL